MLAWGHNMLVLEQLYGLKHILIDIEGLFCTQGYVFLCPLQINRSLSHQFLHIICIGVIRADSETINSCCRMTSRLCRNFKNTNFKPGLRFAVVGQVCHGENALFATTIERSGKELTAFYDARDNFHVPDDGFVSEHDDSIDGLDSDGSEMDSDEDTMVTL